MKIAQVVSVFPPYLSGTGNVCYHNSLELAKLGHSVTVLTSKYPSVPHTYPDDITVRRFTPLFRFGNAPFIPQLFRLRGFDIIHLHYPFIFGAEAMLCSVRENVTLIVTYHQDLLYTGLLAQFIRIYEKLVKTRILSKARKILVPTMDYARHSSISQLVQQKEQDVIELPNGVDVDKFNPFVSGDDVARRLGINKNTTSVILFVGALDRPHSFKGVAILLRAFSRVASSVDAILVIAGEGDLRQSYMALARELGIQSRVMFTGSVADGELPKYYSLCDFLVLPSVSRAEIFGLVLAEAMATGKAVIASDLPGVRTLVDKGENGFLINPKDVDDLAAKMLYLLENESVRLSFGRQGRKKVEEQYSWDKIGRKLDKIYMESLR